MRIILYLLIYYLWAILDSCTTAICVALVASRPASSPQATTGSATTTTMTTTHLRANNNRSILINWCFTRVQIVVCCRDLTITAKVRSGGCPSLLSHWYTVGAQKLFEKDS